MLEEKIKKWDETKDIALAYEICEELVDFVKEDDLNLDVDVLIENVILWGRSKNLDDPKAQLNKVIEEVGEIAHEITRNNYHTADLEDALGDTLVTIIILADILDFDPIGCLDVAYWAIRNRHGNTMNGTFVKD